MHQRRLGELTVGAIGLGCMGMCMAYGPPQEEAGAATIHRALDLGVTLIDTADIYGPRPTSGSSGATIAGAARRGRARDQVRQRWHGGAARGVNGRPEYVRSACDASLRRLARRPHRPLLPAPRRPRRPDRGDRRRDGRARRGRQGPLPRTLRGLAGDDPPRARGAPDHGAADRVLALDARLEAGDPADDPRARHRPRRLQPARPRLPDRHDHARSTSSTTDDFRRNTPRFQRARGQPRLSSTRVGGTRARAQMSPPRSSRSRGCSRRASDIVPIPGRPSRSGVEENVAAAELDAERRGARRRSTRQLRSVRRSATATPRR